MGQRHQVYAAIREHRGDAQNNNHRVATVKVGIHHQWLYGMTACKMANRLMSLVTGDGIYESNNPFDGKTAAIRTLQAVYSYIPEEGYYHGTCELTNGETNDPTLGDNNDGITLFDMRRCGERKKDGVGKVVRDAVGYCLMNINHLEGDEKACENIKPFTPLTIAQYVDMYYPPEADAHWKLETRHVDGEYKVVGRKPKGYIEGTERMIATIKRKAAKWRVLTQAEVFDLWPALRAHAIEAKVPILAEALGKPPESACTGVMAGPKSKRAR